MFVVSSTTYGISQRLQAYAQMSDAIARAAVARGTAADRAFIFQVSGANSRPAAVSTVGMGGGVFVEAVGQSTQAAASTEAATKMIVTAISAELRAQSAESAR
jgi:hypothetical protein